jgi:membrane protein DedA with SNARE-associated domain
MDPAIAALARYGYTVVFGWVLAEQIGLPIPAVPFLLASGALAGRGHLNLALIVVAACVAALISDMIWYAIGRTSGTRVLAWLCRISSDPDACMRRTRERFTKYGAPSLLIAKFVPGFNTAAPSLAGTIGMPLPRYLLFSVLGSIFWASSWVGLGWAFSAHLETVVAHVVRVGGWLAAVAAVAVLIHLGWKYIAREDAPQIAPAPGVGALLSH